MYELKIRLKSVSVAVEFEVEVEAVLGKKYGLLPYKGWGSPSSIPSLKFLLLVSLVSHDVTFY